MLRALLIVLSLLLSAPATAMPACHAAAPGGSAHVTHGEGHRPSPTLAPDHACVGCIPPATWRAPHLAAPALTAEVVPDARVTRLDLGSGPLPLLRPPRLG